MGDKITNKYFKYSLVAMIVGLVVKLLFQLQIFVSSLLGVINPSKIDVEILDTKGLEKMSNEFYISIMIGEVVQSLIMIFILVNGLLIVQKIYKTSQLLSFDFKKLYYIGYGYILSAFFSLIMYFAVAPMTIETLPDSEKINIVLESPLFVNSLVYGLFMICVGMLVKHSGLIKKENEEIV